MHLTEIYDQYYQRVRKFILHMVRDDWVADETMAPHLPATRPVQVGSKIVTSGRDKSDLV